MVGLIIIFSLIVIFNSDYLQTLFESVFIKHNGLQLHQNGSRLGLLLTRLTARTDVSLVGATVRYADYTIFVTMVAVSD